MPSGMITLSYSVPAVVIPPVVGDAALPTSHLALGFTPASVGALVGTSGHSISIDTARGMVELLQDGRVVHKAIGEGLKDLKKGSFVVQHKQRSPIWYAPDSYYTTRGLEVPSSGDRARYLRGALGEFALFIDRDTPLHSGPLFSKEVGGARFGEKDLSKIYYLLDVGDTVSVR